MKNNKYIYICIYRRIITVDIDRIETTAIKYMSPQLRLICAQGRDYIYIYSYIMQVQVHASMNPSTTSSVASLGNIGRWAVAPLQQIEVLHLYRWYTHTHAPPKRGRWNENESEMKMKMKWNLLNQDAKRGTQKKTDRENTNTTHLARWKGKEKEKKSGGRRTAEQDQRRGGRRKRLNQPNTAKTDTYLSTRRTQPTCREENTWNKGPMGD